MNLFQRRVHVKHLVYDGLETLQQLLDKGFRITVCMIGKDRVEAFISLEKLEFQRLVGRVVGQLLNG